MGTGGVCLSLSALFSQAVHSPVLSLTCALVLAVVLVNGWTDAPNAIAAAVGAGALSFRRAALLAAACNLLGALVMTAVNASVAETLYDMADFGSSPADALPALCAALCAIVVWAAAAWRFGVPTSESHALAAGLSGAALALPGGLSNLRPGPWGRILLGLAGSLLLGWLAGAVCRRLAGRLRPSPALCRRGQVAGAAVMAFLHGAQDGQKFLGVFLLAASLSGGHTAGFAPEPGLTLLCAAVMALGTALGGRRIVDTVGRDMVRLGPAEGLAADLGGGFCLLFCTLAGLPVSTTHAKTAAILGAGAGGGVNRAVAGRIVRTWLWTFPGCGLLGFLLASLFRSSPFCGII